MLATKSASFVKDFLDMRPHAVIVVEGSAEVVAPAVDAKGNTVLPPEVDAAISEAMVSMGEGKTPEQRAALRATMVEAQVKRLNGAASPAGRY